MGSPILIPVVVDPSGAISGAQDVDDALQKTGKAVDAVTTGGQVNTEQLTEQFRTQTTVIQEETKKQTAAVSDGIEDQNRLQKEGLRAGATAVAQTAAQTAGAFDGSISGLTNAATNIGATIASVATGPLVVIATVATAVFGVISGLINKSTTDTAAFNARVDSTAAELEKLGVKGVGGVSAVNAELQKLGTTAGDNGQTLNSLSTIAQNAGVSGVDLQEAYAGNIPVLKSLTATTKEHIAALTAQLNEMPANTKAQIDAQIPVRAALTNYQALNDVLNTANDTYTAATKVANEYSKAAEKAALSSKEWSDAGTALAGIGDALQSQQSDLNSKIASDQQTLATAMADSNGKLTDALKNARTALAKDEATENQNTLAGFEGTLNSEVQALLASNASKIEIYEKFGKDAGAAIIKDVGNNATLLQAIAGAGPADIAKIQASYALAGTAASQSLTKAAQAGLNAHSLTFAPVQIDADTSKASRSLTVFEKNVPGITIPVAIDTSAIEQKLAKITSKSYLVQITAKLGKQVVG